MPIIVDQGSNVTYNPGTGTYQNGTDIVSLAKQVCAKYGVDWPIFGGTVEAETNWRNVIHKYDYVWKNHGIYAVGYGGVMLNFHYGHAQRIIDDWGLSKPSFDYKKKPDGRKDKAHAEAYMNWVIGNHTVSLAFMALVLKGYWEAAGKDFTAFTKKYVGPKVPASDIERRRKIYQKYLDGHVPGLAPAEVDTTGTGAADAKSISLATEYIEYQERDVTSQDDPRVNLDPIPNVTGNVPKPDALPPDYYNDDFSKLSHRVIQDGVHYVRIGDCHFAVPPTQIRVSESNGINTYKSVRQKQSIKTHSGAKTKIIEMTLMFPSKSHINGFAVSDNPGGTTYYMDGLSSLLAQMKTMPFLPIENVYLNLAHKIYAVALLNINIETVPGFPFFLKAELTMLEFDSAPYVYAGSEFYDYHFMWPLFRWHYQRHLSKDKDGIEILGDYTGDQYFGFWMYDEEALKGQELAIMNANQAKIKETNDLLLDKDKTNDANLEREQTFYDINNKEDSKLRKKIDFPNELFLISASASTGNTFTPMNIEESGKPAYQYFGSQDTRFQLIFETVSQESIGALTMIKDEVDRVSREYRTRIKNSALTIENSFINFHGVSNVLWESLAVNTVPGFPGRYMVAMTFISYDATQYQDEKLNYISGAWTGSKKDTAKFTQEELTANMQGTSLHTFDNNIAAEVRAELALNKVELYPDLSLPTFTEVNKAIKKINDWRTTKNLNPLPITSITAPPGGHWVDPDFYFSYPSIKTLSAEINKMEPDMGLDDYNWENYYGSKSAENFIKQHTGEDGKNKNQELMKRYGELNGVTYNKDSNKFEGNFKDGYQSSLEVLKEDRNYVMDPKNYQSKFWTRAWTTRDGGGWVKGKDRTIMGTQAKISYYNKQFPRHRKELKNKSYEDIYHRMLHDAIKYDRRGTMMRAFPTFCFVIIDEGEMINANRLWNNYYTYHSIVDISVMMDRRNPAHVATVTLSNVYGSLSHTNRFLTSMPDLNDPSLGHLWQQMKDAIIHQANARALDERRKIYDAALLQAGARVHLRLGYGSTSSMLTPVFNGVVGEITHGDVVQIVCQSDGHELTKLIATPAKWWEGADDKRNSIWFEGIEPQEIFRHYMVDRNDNWVFAYRETADKRNYESAYGIEHFGYLRVADERGAGDFFNPLIGIFGNEEKAMNAEDYDIMKNIYMTNTIEDMIGGTLGETKSYEDIWESERKKLEKEMHYTNMYRPSGNRHNLSGYKIRNYKVAGLSAEKPIIKYIENQDHIAVVMETINEGRVQQVKYKNGVIDGEVVNYKLKAADITKMKEAILNWFANDLHKIYNQGKEANEARVRDVLVGAPINGKITKEIRDLAIKIGKEHRVVHEKAAKAKKEYDERIKAEKKKSAQSGGIGEKNLVMRLDDKSPWDIFRTIERVTPEFVVYPHIHNFHYTLFFGKKHWDVQAGYVLPDIGKKEKDGHPWGAKITDYVELTKPFQQAHFYIGGMDIIGNTITANGTGLTTAVIPTYYLDNQATEFDEIIWADYSIRTSFQSTEIVNTDLVQDIPFDPIIVPDSWVDKAWTGIANMFGAKTKYQKYAVFFAQATIAEKFQNMYQGELIVIGDASVKPYDIFYMMDGVNRMSGVAEVGRVIHHFGVSTGFITTITPDLCVAKNPDPLADSKEWHTNENGEPSGAMYQYSQLAGRAAYYGLAVGSTLYTARRIGFKALATGMLKLNQARKANGIVNSVRNVAGAAKAFRTIKGIKNAWTAAIGTMAAAGAAVPVAGWASLVVTAALWFSGEIIFNYIERIFTQRFKNVIKIFPLYHQGKPYVAGINGSQYLIPGWQINGDGMPMSVGFDGDEYKPQVNGMSWDEYVKEIEATAEKGSNEDAKNAVGVQSLEWFTEQVDSKKMQEDNNSIYWPTSMADSSRRNLAGTLARVTSNWGMRSGKMHWGSDIGKGSGGGDRNILSIANGTVVESKTSSSYGKVIVVRHSFPMKQAARSVGANTNSIVGWNSTKTVYMYSLYAHLSSVDIKKGQTVKAGQKLGVMGDTGDSSGVHLHFEIGTPKDVSKAADISYDNFVSKNKAKTERTYMNMFDPATFFKACDTQKLFKAKG